MAQVVQRLSRQDPRVDLLLRCDRSGLSSAIRDELLSASSELAVVIDADGQYDPTVIHAAVAFLEQQGLDLVVGSRFHGDALRGAAEDCRAFGKTPVRLGAACQLAGAAQPANLQPPE